MREIIYIESRNRPVKVSWEKEPKNKITPQILYKLGQIIYVLILN